MEVIYESHLKEIKQALKEQTEQALIAIGARAETHAKKYCPVKTGNLRNSIKPAHVTDEKAVYIGTNVEYAPYVELGTSRAKAQPYLRPAIENHTDEYKRLFEAALKSG